MQQPSSARIVYQKIKNKLVKASSYQVRPASSDLKQSPKKDPLKLGFFGQKKFTMKMIEIQKQGSLSPDRLLNYILQAFNHLFKEDESNYSILMRHLLKQNLHDLKEKLHQRINPLKYLEVSLRYKAFADIEVEIQREWRKNQLFISINYIWCECAKKQPYNNPKSFKDFYDKQRELITNVSYYFFKNTLKLLELKGVDVFELIHHEISHYILNSSSEWKSVYENQVNYLLNAKQQINPEINFEFNLLSLDINELCLDLTAIDNQLYLTTQLIRKFSREYKIQKKINLLSEIRKTLICEMEANIKRSMEEEKMQKHPVIEKDDFIGCFIYCIIRGKITNLFQSIASIAYLLGKDNQLLSKKGVDSYRTDLECATQFLLQHNNQKDDHVQSTSKMPTLLLQTELQESSN